MKTAKLALEINRAHDRAVMGGQLVALLAAKGVQVRVCPECHTLQHVTSPDVIKHGCSICRYPVAGRPSA